MSEASLVEGTAPLSAGSSARLVTYARSLRDHLAAVSADGTAPSMARVAFTLQTGREPMAHRLVLRCATIPELIEALDAVSSGRSHPAVSSGVAWPGERPFGRPDPKLDPADAWLAGYEVPWESYWTAPPGRVSLPTYPRDDAHPDPAATCPATAGAEGDAGLRARAEAYLRARYAQVAELPLERLDVHVPLEQYGLSSLVVARLNGLLERDLGPIPQSLFFEHRDLAGVVGALMDRDGPWRTPGPTSGTGARDPGRTGHPVIRERHATTSTSEGDDRAIAILGISGRYPQAPDLDQFWDNLIDGRDCVGPLPRGRARPGWPTDLMWGGFLDGVDRFDPLLFNITPRDAALMDPQERLFLEATWEALEDAGYPRTRIRDRHGSRVSVYAGSMYNEYPFFGVEQSMRGARQDSGSAIGGIANRVSYHFDLRGPSMTIDTMCSSGLVALHLAIQALRRGECEMAIAGAVNLSLHPNKFVQHRRMRLTASGGRCRSFGRGGDGFVPSEGVGVVVLKPLHRALADGDRVHAVVRGTAVSHMGRTNGWIVPNPAMQAEVVRAALADAAVDPCTIGYLEAHGAGTELGDPLEIEGLERVFGAAGLEPGRIPIGSVKSGIGHVEAAAGIAALTKTVLQMRHRRLAPSLHAEELNPKIAWDRVPFRLQREAAEWPAPACGAVPRRAGVSSFGAGGTIAHIVLEAWEPESSPVGAGGAGGPELLVLSAQDEERLRAAAARLAARLRQGAGAPPLNVADVAHTLQVGREPLRERLALVVGDVTTAAERLDRFGSGAGADEAGVLRGRADVLEGQRGPMAPDGDGPLDEPGLKRVAGQWVDGGDVDWSRLRPPGREPRLIALPHYPFALMRCWIAETSESDAPAGSAADRDMMPAEVPLYRKTWVRDDATAAGRMVTGSILVLFGDRTEAIAREIAAAAPGRAVLNRLGADRDDGVPSYTGEREAVIVTGEQLARTPEPAAWVDLCDVDAGEDLGLWRARLAALRQLVSYRSAHGLRVLHLTRGLQGPPGVTAGLAGARMAGFVRMLGAEYPRIRATTCDTDRFTGRPAEFAREVLAELNAGCSYGECAYRGGVRHTPRLSPSPYPAAAPLRLDPGGAYVLSGATRGIGARVARHLVERGARRVALVGARSLPGRAEWDRDGLPAEAAAGIGTVRLLESLGAEVRVHRGALTDAGEMEAFLASVRADWGRVAGVVHSAGRGGRRTCPFAHRGAVESHAMLEPKTDGLDALAAACSDGQPDFFLLFSSICAAVPRLAAGVADYAAANAYMDFFASYQAELGREYFRSVNWPMWRDSGSGAGGRNVCEPVGLDSLGDAAGLRVLERVLAMPGGAAVLPCPPLDGKEPDLDALLRVGGPAEPAFAVAAVHEPEPDPLPAPCPTLAADPTPAPQNTGAAVPPWLVELFSRVLGLPAEQLDPDIGFAELGVESVMLGELLQRIEERLDRRLEPATLLRHATLRRLSTHLGLENAVPTTEVTARPMAGPAPPGATGASLSGGRQAVPGKFAIIGMACRFPDAPDITMFWSNLVSGRCSVTEVPPSRWDHRSLYGTDPRPGRSIGKWGGFLEGIEEFDAGFFGMDDAEAAALDPVIRLFLESTAGCLSDAGYPAPELRGRRVGVFAAGRTSDYAHRGRLRPSVLQSDQNFIAAQVAHRHDFRGPNLVVDSACSSSLVALQLACRALAAGDAEVALVGGVEVLLDERPYLEFSAARALSPTGRCATFDERADGFVPGEGAGAVLVKPLGAALADGDRIHAVIEAAQVNNDGSTMGVTTPNPAAQADVIRRALAESGRRPEEIGMVEAHGTGTLIGDSIELRALADVFREGDADPGRTGWCAIGSVKSNLGHLLAAAGMAGLLKAVLAIENGQIPPTLFCERPNPRFDFAASPFVPAGRLRTWSPERGTRIAGVSSFGLGGTNAHVIVAQLDPAARTGAPAPRELLPAPRFQRRRLWLDRAPEGDVDRDRRAGMPETTTTIPEAAGSSQAARPPVASLLELDFVGG